MCLCNFLVSVRLYKMYQNSYISQKYLQISLLFVSLLWDLFFFFACKSDELTLVQGDHTASTDGDGLCHNKITARLIE